MNNYWEQLLDKARANHLNLDFDKIKLALGFAEESHQGQYRKSGDDYIIHPVEVAKILMDMKMDTDTIVAGLLHDVVEDTLIPIADIKYKDRRENGFKKICSINRKLSKRRNYI